MKYQAKNAALKELLQLIMPSMLEGGSPEKEMGGLKNKKMMEEEESDDEEEMCGSDMMEEMAPKKPKMTLSLTRIVADQKNHSPKKTEFKGKKK